MFLKLYRIIFCQKCWHIFKLSHLLPKFSCMLPKLTSQWNLEFVLTKKIFAYAWNFSGWSRNWQEGRVEYLDHPSEFLNEGIQPCEMKSESASRTQVFLCRYAQLLPAEGNARRGFLPELHIGGLPGIVVASLPKKPRPIPALSLGWCDMPTFLKAILASKWRLGRSTGMIFKLSLHVSIGPILVFARQFNRCQHFEVQCSNTSYLEYTWNSKNISELPSDTANMMFSKYHNVS